ncbi:conserved hypothetical protein [Shewanella sediminis HAW-EB3]|uniref:Uncharacterized protein n=1 Tax=Shewanella sediminis (strain HAW-EB3) TaxID=425104 RepID=A8G088_SHESH|nr:DUF4144 family protein [Shewanella sediminis]ABV38511.1 conserved hypothetical protein [Shewanella sediminis HAW-EB3]
MNCDENRHIKWPAILIQEDQAELVYLSSEQDWLLEQQSHIVQSSRLLDASGITYRLIPAQRTQLKPDKQLSWHVSDEPLRLPRVLALVRQHAGVSGHCCTAKLNAVSMEQIFEIMKYLEES